MRMEKIDSLADLPPEVLQSIFTYLPLPFCLSTLPRVCPLFYRLLNDDNWWKARKKAARLVVDEREEEKEEYSLQRVLCRAEEEETRWKRISHQKMYSLSAHYGAINSCKLYTESSGGMRCISAGRDRTIRLWDLDRFVLDVDGAEEGGDSTLANLEEINRGGRKEIVHSVDLAHSGWIWVVARPNSSNITFSCGWDNLVRGWQITPAAMRENRQLNLSSAVLGMDWIDGNENELVVSTFLRRVCLLDVREGRMESTAEHTEHRNAVIGVASRGHSIYSWGEDRLVVMADTRKMNTPVAKAVIPRSYASQLSIGPTSIVAATMKGEYFYLDPHTLESWGSLNVQSVCDGEKISSGTRTDPLRGIINTGHSILTLSKYGKFNALSYGLKPRSVIESVKLDGEPSRIDCLNESIVVSMGDGRIVYWPKPTSSFKSTE
ncbi:hypothetical protein PFISCL1PPCAC_5755 [Pristionchus fissidentatus]|uniref:F-box domain-containing protein n=1 Tax=Pristionchus fissidentatus TaxID=1538716 RepID=A0AAV5V8A7_9BILA|nr:hypothetical protein PFISCL1PPCAC_5755 [Pristionchus fissidentatus]